MAGLPADDVLAERLRSGDDDTFALLLDGWSGGMLRVARSFVSTEESAAEVVQETWLAVIEGIERFEGRSSLRPGCTGSSPTPPSGAAPANTKSSR